MDDVNLRCVIWWPGDAPPDVSHFVEPLSLPFNVLIPTRSGEPEPAGDEGESDE